MGCDIHAAIEVRKKGKWVAELFPNRWAGEDWGEGKGPEPTLSASLDFNRNYDAFAILANVRNGSGFAGVDTGDGFEPISDQRGLPEDISEAAREQGCTGDHSDTYVTLKELLDCDWTRESLHRGWVNGVEFEKWDRMKRWSPGPDSYAGGVSGGSVKHISEGEMRKLVDSVMKKNAPEIPYAQRLKEVEKKYSSHYCQLQWSETYAEASGQLWKKWMPIMLKLGREFGEENVRMVMNFDS